MEKQVVRVEPFSTYAEKRKVPISLVVVHGGLVYVSQMPPYDPATGGVRRFPVAEQMEIVIQQMERCLQAAGSALSRVIQCTLYCNDPAHFQIINEIYGRFFTSDPPSRNLIFVSGWHGPFDVEISCVAAASDKDPWHATNSIASALRATRTKWRYLNCAALDWEPVGVDFAGGETRDAHWRAYTNAMGEVPVLEVDGRLMSQSGAILTWLAETTSKFAPADSQRVEALRWLLFDNHKFTNNYAMHRFQKSFTHEPVHPAILAFLRSRVEASHAIADKHLKDRPFVLGDQPTIVDFSMAGYVYYPPAETGFALAADFPALDAWRQRLAALPGWKPPYELMPVGSLPVRAS